MGMGIKRALVVGLTIALPVLFGNGAHAQVSETARVKIRLHFIDHIRRSQAEVVKVVRTIPAALFGHHIVIWIHVKNNRIIASRVEQSSGFAHLDNAALRIVRRASPLPRWRDVEPIENRTFSVPIRFHHGSGFTVGAHDPEFRRAG